MSAFQTPAAEKTLILVGAGPGHLTLMRSAEKYLAAGIRMVLIDTDPFYFMPNMTAEVMGGYYGLEDFHIDLKSLAQRRKASFIHDEVVNLLLQQRKVLTAEGRMLDYDAVSFEIGSLPDGQEDDIPPEGSFPVWPVKNVLQIRNEVETLLELFPRKRIEIVVLGAGLSGVEYAINISEILQQRKPESGWQIILLEAQPEILPGLPHRAAALAHRMLAVNDIQVRTQTPVQHIQSNRLVLEFGETVEYDLAVVATGRRVDDLFNRAGLETNVQGALSVRPTLQSLAHGEVFACGSCIQIGQREEIHSVDEAVRQGALLAQNLLAWFNQKPLRPLPPGKPPQRFISLGNSNAMCLIGGHVFSGHGVLLWKRWRERRRLKNLAR